MNGKLRQRKDSDMKKESAENRGNTKKKTGWKGSYTVEASLVFGMTFFVLAALLIVTFYVHDKAVMQAITCEAASVGSNYLKAKDRSEAVKKVRNQMKEDRLLGSKKLTGAASAGSREVLASWKASHPIPGMVLSYLGKNNLQIQTEWISQIADPADTIRKIRGAGRILTGGEQ